LELDRDSDVIKLNILPLENRLFHHIICLKVGSKIFYVYYIQVLLYTSRWVYPLFRSFRTHVIIRLTVHTKIN